MQTSTFKCTIFPNFSLGGPFILRDVITIEEQKASHSDCIMSMLQSAN
jgi:hypothetical protein